MNEKRASELFFWLGIGFIVGCLSVALSGCKVQRRCTVTHPNEVTTSLMAYSYSVRNGALFIGGRVFAPGTWTSVDCQRGQP